MSRSKWKGYFLTNRFLKKSKVLNKKNVSVWERNCTIPSYLVGKSVFIHNGKSFIRIFVSREKVGFKFGEFVYTRRHTPKPIKKIEKKKKK